MFRFSLTAKFRDIEQTLTLEDLRAEVQAIQETVPSTEEDPTQVKAIQETYRHPSELGIEPTPVQTRPKRRERNSTDSRRHGMYLENDGPYPPRKKLEPVSEETATLLNESKQDAHLSPTTTVAKSFWEYANSDHARYCWGKRTIDNMLTDFRTNFQPQQSDEGALGESIARDSANSGDLNPNTTGKSVDTTHMPLTRSGSNISKASARSSGYYSCRDSALSFDDPGLETVNEVRSRSSSIESYKSVTDNFSCCSSLTESVHSHQSSTDDDDYHSCASMPSLDGQTTVTGTLS